MTTSWTLPMAVGGINDREVLRQAVRKTGCRPGRVVVVEGKAPPPLPGGCCAGMESGA